MVDIRGFTRLASEIDPDAWIWILADDQSRMVTIIQQNGGTIQKENGLSAGGTPGGLAVGRAHAYIIA